MQTAPFFTFIVRRTDAGRIQRRDCPQTLSIVQPLCKLSCGCGDFGTKTVTHKVHFGKVGSLQQLQLPQQHGQQKTGHFSAGCGFAYKKSLSGT